MTYNRITCEAKKNSIFCLLKEQTKNIIFSTNRRFVGNIFISNLLTISTKYLNIVKINLT